MVATDQLGVMLEGPANRPRRRALSITPEGVFLALFVGGLAWVPFWLGSIIQVQKLPLIWQI